MKKTFIIANWKSNKTESEATSWFQGLKIKNLRLTNKKIIVCPSFTALPILRSLIINHKSSIKLGAQNISPFNEGHYTGEINAKQIKEFADYVIIGHSERRKNFLESDEIVNLKIDQAFKYKLTPIVCVSSLDQIKKLKTIATNNPNFIIAYEPLFAIGSGTPDTPENANQMAKNIKDILGQIPVLYGGSVNSNNISSFAKTPNIDGALVGKASLDIQGFYEIIQNA